MIQRTTLFWILLLAAFLRFYGLSDESLWLDEAIIANRIANTYPQLMTDADSDRQGPLYTLVTKAWCDQFGNDEFNLRLTAAVFGVMAVIFIFLLGKALYGRTAGLISALFMTLNPFAIYYSQEARPYSLFLLGSTASLYYLIRLLQGSKTRRDLLGYIFASTAALYSHPFGPFLVLCFGLILIGYRWLSRDAFLESWRRVLAGSTAVFVLYLPMLYIFAMTFYRKVGNPSVAGSWIQQAPLSEMLNDLILYFNHPLTAIAVYLLIAFSIFGAVRKKQITLLPYWVTLSLTISFLLIPWLISVAITPVYILRYSIPTVSGVLIVLGFAIAMLPLKYRGIVIVILIAAHAPPLYYYYTCIDKDPWRQAVEIVQPQVRENDMIYLIPSYAMRPLDYYYEPVKGVRINTMRHMAEFKGIRDHIERVWFIGSYHSRAPAVEGLRDTLSQWGDADPAIFMKSILPMNPYCYFASDIEIITFHRKER